jgi:hypothetical protein
MRHIPDEELHAYLDQALSRSQCVEIESHLAYCLACRRKRDDIAALRDRTTALLATLAPPHRIPPPVAEIRARADARTRRRRRMFRGAAWAASILLALGFGWIASSWVGSTGRPTPAETATLIPEPAAPESGPAQDTGTPNQAVAQQEASDPARIPVNVPVSQTVSEPTPARSGEPDPIAGIIAEIPVEPLEVEITPVLSPSEDGLLADGLWRSVSWDGAQSESDGWVPRVEGLPVVEVRMQSDEEGSGSPLTVVAQRLSGGEMIRTVEGPIAKVSDLLSHQPGQNVTASVEVSDTTGTQKDERMLAIYGSVPIDSLRAFLLKVR